MGGEAMRPSEPRRWTMQLILRLLAPYLSVLIFWFGFRNGWLAILGYHAQILLWGRRTLRRPRIPDGVALLWGAPAAGAGPLLYLLLPRVSRLEFPLWLQEFHLEGWSLVLLIPYFGLLHPVLEEHHWAPLRERTPLSHAFFAGYHGLVLASLLRWPWVVLAVALLGGVSVGWKRLARRAGGSGATIVSHVGADLGVIVAAWLRSS